MVNYLFEFSIILNSFPFSIFLNITLALEKLRALQLNAYQLSGILQSLWSSFDRNPDVTSETDCDLDADDDQARLQCLYSMAYYYHAKSLEVNEINDINHINNALLFYKQVT